MYSYLALGDSYTIGEQVRPGDNFPFQTVELLNKHIPETRYEKQGFDSPLIIAKTGWTSDELNTAINSAKTLKQYDIVSLLIGVNDQYRGRNVSVFKDNFDVLIQRAIGFADNNPAHVFVLSIPDWGVTPFAEGKDRRKISAEIDSFNDVCSTSAKHYQTNYIDITKFQRIDGHKPEYLAVDKLHPSAKEYAKWAIQLSQKIGEVGMPF